MGHKSGSPFPKGKWKPCYVQTRKMGTLQFVKLKQMNYLRYMQDINMYAFFQGLSFKKTMLRDGSVIIHQIINLVGLFLLVQDVKLHFYPVIVGRCTSKVVLGSSLQQCFPF